MWNVILCFVALVGTAVHAGNGPIFMEQPQATIFDTSSNVDTVTLNCRAIGDAPITYSWQKDGEELSPGNNERLVIAGGKLTITTPDRTVDAGKYVCVAQNNIGTVRSLPAELMFAYVDAFPPGGSQSEVLTLGEGRCLNCYPPAHYPDGISVSWYKGMSTMINPGDDRIRIMDDGRLCFSEVLQSYEGEYRCHVMSAVESEAGVSAKISPGIAVTVQAVSNPETRINIIEANKPKDLTVLAGEDVSFECFFFGKTAEGDAPRIQWTRTSPPGASNPSFSSLSDRGEVFEIPNVRPEDAGTYFCSVADNSGGAGATLTVVEPPRWISKPLSVQKDIQTTQQWDVQATDGVSYTWYRNAVELDNLPRHQLNNNFQTLIISDLEVTDTAMYQCFAANDYGIIDATAQLTVRAFSPEFQSEMEIDQPAPLGGMVTIRCPVDGAPIPTFTWSRNGEAITNSAHYNLTSNPPHLVIMNVEQSDEGQYTCRAENTFGADDSTGSIEIKDHTVIVVPPETQHIGLGESTTLECRATYDLSLDLTYVWQHNGVEINLGESNQFRMPVDRESGKLEINGIRMQDGGDYTCVAMTVIDSDTRTATIHVIGPPGPPSGLSVSVETDGSVTLSWSPGSSNNSPITSYVVEGKTEYEDEWTMLRDVEGTNSVRLTNLTPYSLYTFRVYAVNAIGSGDPSEPTEAAERTSKYQPTESPSGVGGGGGNEGDLRITWDAFPQSKWNSDNVTYNIEYRQVGSEVKTEGSIDDSMATVFVATENILLYTQYEVRVRAQNDVKAGPWSVWVVIYSYQEVPQTAPSGVSASGSSAYSLEVTWNGIDASSFQGELMGYKLMYWPQQGGNKMSATTAISEGVGTTATIPDLEANTRFVVVVLAYSGSGDGPESSEVTTQTLKSEPQQMPTNVRASVSGTVVTVQWDGITTSSDEESLEGYKIRYRREGVFAEDAETIISQGTGTKATIPNLTVGTTYLITVQGYSAGGMGVSSNPPISITTGTAKVAQSGDDPESGASRTIQALSLSLILASLLHSLYHLL